MRPPVAGLPASLELVTLQGRVVRPSRFRLRGRLPAGECSCDAERRPSGICHTDSQD